MIVTINRKKVTCIDMNRMISKDRKNIKRNNIGIMPIEGKY